MSVLAFDLGAGSGRALLGRLKDDRIEMEELHRFANIPVQLGDRLHWDILRIFHEIKQGLLQTKHVKAEPLQSMAIDSWAVDFGLLGENGELLGNPYHYRDHHTDGMMEKLFETVPKEEIFQRTGIQFLPFNTIYQLFALQQAGSPLLRQSKALLMIPDLLRYFLTGESYGEFTNATTTQLYNPRDQKWDSTLLKKLQLPESIFPELLSPGSRAGELRGSIRTELGMNQLPVYTAAEHDTASAVAAIPATEKSFAYLSCGTWSLMGTEVEQPIINEQALSLNFTNEGGVGGTYRLLKNIMGLWILEECRRAWEKEGENASHEQLLAEMRQSAPFQSFIDPDAPEFLNPPHMPQQIEAFCRRTGQPVPQSRGEMVRCILESLALKYRYVMQATEDLSGQAFSGLHMVGGGIKNEHLCQFTANALGRPVWAGPAEGSAIGNILLQYIALKEFTDIWQAREAVRNSVELKTYEPQDSQRWEEAYREFADKLL